MPIALQPGSVQPLSNLGVLDDAERGIGAGFAALVQSLRAAIADFIQDGAFLQTLPGGNHANSGDAVFACLIGRFENRR